VSWSTGHESDFVARNEQFQDWSRVIAQSRSTLRDGRRSRLPGRQRNGRDRHCQTQIATITRTSTLRRAASLEVGQRVVSSYVHMPCEAPRDRRDRGAGIHPDRLRLATLARGNRHHKLPRPTRRRWSAAARSIVVKREKDVLADKYASRARPERDRKDRRVRRLKTITRKSACSSRPHPR